MIRPPAVVAVLALALAFTTSCTKRSEANDVDAESILPPTARAPVCRGCDGVEPVKWGFVGMYRDSACKRPVIQALHMACAPVSLPASGAEAKVSIFERFRGQRGLGQELLLSVRAPVTPQDKLFLLREGACRPQDDKTKRLPAGCSNGGLVCRTASGALACDSCRKLANGCADYEGVMAYLEVSP